MTEVANVRAFFTHVEVLIQLDDGSKSVLLRWACVEQERTIEGRKK